MRKMTEMLERAAALLEQIADAGLGGGGGIDPGNDLVWLSGDGPPVDGVAGTGAGTAGPGSIYTDVTNVVEYRNHNTKASPTWVAVIAR